MMISNRSSAAVIGNLRMPKSSIRRSGTVVSDSMNSLRVPSATRIFPLADKSARGQIEDQAAVHLRVECKVEVVQSPLWVAEGRLFTPSFQQPIAPPVQLVGDQARDQIDRRHGFGLRLMQAG